MDTTLENALSYYYKERSILRRAEEFAEESNLEVANIAELPQLAEVDGAPEFLFFRGSRELLTRPAIAIVGSRKASPYGLRAARSFASELAGIGLNVISGLAAGIDSAAHEGALMAGGPTLAVLGHGHSYCYPKENLGLLEKIISSGGCVVSEYPPFLSPRGFMFPQRNRIISGLSLGVLIIEAGLQSGSLITARHALNQNREVFVLPAQYDAMRFYGGHQWIKKGAKLICCLQDILEEIPYIAKAIKGLGTIEPQELEEIYLQNFAQRENYFKERV